MPRTMFIFVASYASALTMFVIYLWWTGSLASSQLESLPDLKPLEDNEFRIVPVGKAMPWGHRLRVGDVQQFGNIKVHVLRVTRGPVEFEYFQKGPEAPQRPPSQPVLKLWLEFENVSQDQIFSPYDLRLMSRDFVDDNLKRFANTFVRNQSDSGEAAQLTFAMSHEIDDPFDIKGLEAGRMLKPSEKCVIFIPTEEDGVDQLAGDLVWRVQFRKGFHPVAMHGVTTLIEVEFHSDDIQTDS